MSCQGPLHMRRPSYEISSRFCGPGHWTLFDVNLGILLAQERGHCGSLWHPTPYHLTSENPPQPTQVQEAYCSAVLA